MRALFLYSTVVIFILSCGQNDEKRIQNVYKWINDEDNGLKKTKIIDDVQITVKYLPAELQAYRDLEENEAKSNFDSLVRSYSHQKSFMVSFKSMDDSKNIMYKDVSDKDDYDQRIKDLSFDIGRKLKMTICGSDLRPTLFHYEPNYGSSKTANIYVVFSGEKVMNCDDAFNIAYYDHVFGTGISHFTFKQNDINRIPKLKI